MKVIKLILVMAILALLPAITWAVPGDGLAGTDHDFVAGPFSTSAPGLCTFCHTPHKANSTALLWNHTLSSATFTWGDATSTTGGTAYPAILGGTYKGPTAKCLSCHDGSVAVGDVYWYDEAARHGGSALDTNMITDDTHRVGFGASMTGNHPVAMPYPFAGTSSTYNAKTTGSGVEITEFRADPRNINLTAIRLFKESSGDVVAGAASGNAGIECSSCHDPHNKQAKDAMFLRAKLTGGTAVSGYICLQCHIK